MPHPEGRGLAEAMRRALGDAGLEREEIGYINAHATSTPQGDRAEAMAIAQVFGPNGPPVSSTKALSGHSLSMSGLFEAAVCAIVLAEGFVPGQAHLSETDCLEINLPLQNAESTFRFALNNSSGFGGANVAHVLERYP